MPRQSGFSFFNNTHHAPPRRYHTSATAATATAATATATAATATAATATAAHTKPKIAPKSAVASNGSWPPVSQFSQENLQAAPPPDFGQQ